MDAGYDQQYLTFDTVYLLPEDADMGKAQAGFFSQIWYECKSVYYSFFSDYDISDAKREYYCLGNYGRA